MTRRELVDRIETWLMLYSSNKTPFPPSPSPEINALRQQTELEWRRGLFENVLALRPCDELKGTVAAQQLDEALAWARTLDASKLDDIERNLRAVHLILRRVPSA